MVATRGPPEATGELQVLQQFSVSSVEDMGESNIRQLRPSSIYAGMQAQTCRVENSSKKDNDDKKGQSTADGKKQQNKTPRDIDDGLFLVGILLGYTDILSGHLSTVVPPDVLLLPPASLNVD